MNLLSTFVSKVFVVLILSFGISWCSWSQDATHLHFGGTNDYVNCGDNVSLDLTASLTLEAMVYRNPSASDDCIIGKDSFSVGKGYSFWIVNDKRFVLRFGNRTFFSINTVPDDTWVHLAATYNAATNTVRLYRDGILDRTIIGVTVPLANSGNLYIGIAQDAVGNAFYGFKGNLDEVRIWNIELTAEEIAGRKNCELTGSEPGLVAYYRFNQGLDAQPNPTVTTLTDATANGNNGTLTNFALTGASSNWLAGSPVITGSTIPATPGVTTPVYYALGAIAAPLTATGSNLLWYATATGGTGSGTAPVPSTLTANTTSYWVTAGNANGCQSARAQIDVIVAPPATHLHFDGVNDYVACGNILPASYTKEAWIYITNAGLRNNIISGGNDSRHAFWAPVDFGNRLSAGHNDVWDLVQDATPLALNTWYHVAVTYDAGTGTMKLYKNGVLVDMATGVPAYTGTNVVRLGSYGTTSYFLQGSMDEVRIWNYVRSDAQISGSMNCELAGNETGLLAYYQFNQGLAGQPNPAVITLTDATANGNNGTLTNFALSGSGSNWLDGSPIITGSVIPAAPTASPQSFCMGATVADLSATGAGTISWYTTAVGGAPLAAATPLATGTYYCAAANVAGCESDRTAANVTITTGNLGLSAKLTWSNTCSPTGTINIIQENLLTNGFTTLPAGATLTGNAVVSGGECVLTSNTSNQAGTIIFGDPAFTAAPLEGNFDFFTGGGSGADGFSFNYGVIPPGNVHPLGNEYGVAASGLVIRFIEYGASRVQLVYNDVVLSAVNFTLNTNTYRTCSFNINKNGALTLSIGGTTIFSNINLPGYTTADRLAWQFAFSARTGGLNNFHKIDNVTIQTPFPTQFSVDGANWQASPLFTGLAMGTYVVMGNRGGPACPEILDTVTFPALTADAVYYVNPNATGYNNGTSWADAFTSLDTALSLNCVKNIWVAEGTYLPSMDTTGNNPADPRDKTFYVKDGKKIYGGFAGNETSLLQRDIAAHPTILSGDIGVSGDSTDNCYHVVILATSAEVTVDGFHIRKGTANGPGNGSGSFGIPIDRSRGGGLYIAKNNLGAYKIVNNYISGNASTNEGAGIYYWSFFGYYNDTISNNIITGNNAYNGSGGGMSIYPGEDATVQIFDNFIGSNTAANGGGIYIPEPFVLFDHSVAINNNVLYNNTATVHGGGIYFQNSLGSFSHNTLVNNAAGTEGGGIYLINCDYPLSIQNNTFWLNKQTGSAALQGADFAKGNNASDYVFKNNSLQLTVGNYTATGSGVYDLGATASGNLFAQNPLFVNENDIAGPDGLFGTADDGLHVFCGSPMLNAGLPVASVTVDVSGYTRNISTPVIGAYEETETGSPVLAGSYKSITITQNNRTEYSDCDGLVAAVQSSGVNPVSGNTSASVWIEPVQPAQFVKRHYEITPAANAATATGRITLYFTQAEFDDFNALNAVDLPTGPADATGKANLLIEKRGGTSSGGGLPQTYSGNITTINPNDADIVWNATWSRWEISFDVTGFSGFFVKTSSFTLPVTLLRFTATKQHNGDVLVQWITEAEQQLSHYEIERSYDGVQFEKAGMVNARNTTGQQEYAFTDNTVWIKDLRYYRLKSVNNDGSYKYSAIVRLQNKQPGSISLYPNPAGEMVTVQVNNARLLHTRATLADAGGRTISTVQINNTYTTVHTGHLARGVYWLRFANGSSLKLVKE